MIYKSTHLLPLEGWIRKLEKFEWEYKNITFSGLDNESFKTSPFTLNVSGGAIFIEQKTNLRLDLCDEKKWEESPDRNSLHTWMSATNSNWTSSRGEPSGEEHWYAN